MKSSLDESIDGMDNNLSNVSVAISKLKKYVYTLPSGRKLKVVVDDGNEDATTVFPLHDCS